MSGHTGSFDEAICVSFLIEDKKLLENMIKSGIKSKMVSKNNLIIKL